MSGDLGFDSDFSTVNPNTRENKCHNHEKLQGFMLQRGFKKQNRMEENIFSHITDKRLNNQRNLATQQ